MASYRLFQRLPEATLSGVAHLNQHQLNFRKNDSGQSGKCDIEATENPSDIVIGVIYQMTTEERSILDQFEGLGDGYNSKQVNVIDQKGKALSAFTYFAIDIDSSMKPYHWYKEHVLRGAIEHKFPQEYIQYIEGFESIADADQERSENELSIYR